MKIRLYDHFTYKKLMAFILPSIAMIFTSIKAMRLLSGERSWLLRSLV